MTDAQLAAERLDALLDAERENTFLRREVEWLRGERAAVVAWLRKVQPGWPAGSGGHADFIERGEHRGEKVTP